MAWKPCFSQKRPLPPPPLLLLCQAVRVRCPELKTKDMFIFSSNTTMTEISDSVYRAVAGRLLAAIGRNDYFNGRIELDIDGCRASLLATLIIYRTPLRSPEGTGRPIADVVPVWWEFSLWNQGEELLNDFSFNELRKLLIL